MIKVYTLNKDGKEKEHIFKDRSKAQRFMYGCPRYNLLILSYQSNDPIETYWLDNRVDISALNSKIL